MPLASLPLCMLTARCGCSAPFGPCLIRTGVGFPLTRPVNVIGRPNWSMPRTLAWSPARSFATSPSVECVCGVSVEWISRAERP
jgi:hypothetical protein